MHHIDILPLSQSLLEKISLSCLVVNFFDPQFQIFWSSYCFSNLLGLQQYPETFDSDHHLSEMVNKWFSRQFSSQNTGPRTCLAGGTSMEMWIIRKIGSHKKILRQGKSPGIKLSQCLLPLFGKVQFGLGNLRCWKLVMCNASLFVSLSLCRVGMTIALLNDSHSFWGKSNSSLGVRKCLAICMNFKTKGFVKQFPQRWLGWNAFDIRLYFHWPIFSEYYMRTALMLTKWKFNSTNLGYEYAVQTGE